MIRRGFKEANHLPRLPARLLTRFSCGCCCCCRCGCSHSCACDEASYQLFVAQDASGIVSRSARHVVLFSSCCCVRGHCGGLFYFSSSDTVQWFGDLQSFVATSILRLVASRRLTGTSTSASPRTSGLICHAVCGQLVIFSTIRLHLLLGLPCLAPLGALGRS